MSASVVGQMDYLVGELTKYPGTEGRVAELNVVKELYTMTPRGDSRELQTGERRVRVKTKGELLSSLDWDKDFTLWMDDDYTYVIDYAEAV